MRIQQLENCTGLDRATIRFYEKENLINPQRSENGYRSYSQADAQDLLKIKLLRQLGMSLEQIRRIKQGSGDITQALQSQIHILEAQVEAKHQSAQVCREMQQAHVTYESMDAQFYLTRLIQIPEAQQSGCPPKTFREPVPKEPHPVRRYVARVLDASLVSIVIQFVLYVVLRLRPIPTGFVTTLISIGYCLISLPVNAFFIHRWGTTPGKWIMGIRVLDFTGKKMTYIDALFREWLAFGSGLGWCLPIYEYYRLYKSFKSYVQTGETDWDEGSVAQFTQWRGKGKAVFAAAATLILVISIWIVTDSYLPTYRDDQLTVAQFAKNYNFCLNQYANAQESGEKLNSDGTYVEEHSGLRYDYGISYEGYMPWTFETEDGIIRRVSGQFTGNVEFSGSISWLTPCKTAAFTAVLSQENATFRDAWELINAWRDIPATPEGQLNYGGVKIIWYTEMINCRCENGYYYILDETQKASITVNFEILYD